MSIRQHVQLIEAASSIEQLHLDKLPYAMSALEPAVSRHNVDVHYNILTKKYFKKYEETGDLFQKAGAVLHNNYFWPMLQPYDKNNKPSKELESKLSQTHGSFAKFKDLVVEQASTVQGNGWVFVMQDLQVQTVQNHVIKQGIVMGIDIWEHSTADYDYDRVKFLEEFWKIVNWTLFEERVGQ